MILMLKNILAKLSIDNIMLFSLEFMDDFYAEKNVSFVTKRQFVFMSNVVFRNK